jgi:hypothetical protein
MNEDVAFPVGFSLRPVMEGEYPEFEDQVWADPVVDEAVSFLVEIVDDPAVGETVGARARAHMLGHFSDATLGAYYRERLAAIAGRSAHRSRIYGSLPLWLWTKVKAVRAI